MADERPPGHELECVGCWLKGMGIDFEVGVSLLAAAYKAGQVAGISSVVPVPPHLAEKMAGPAVIITRFESERIMRYVRSLMAMPMSPDVAEAMRSDHG